jgi:hypothetical protein
MGLFSKLFGGSSTRSTGNVHAKYSPQLQNDPNRLGGPNNPWVCVRPQNLAELREKVVKTVAGTPVIETLCPEGGDLSELDGMIAEMMKMIFLDQVFGKKGKNWECGSRMYLKGSIQTQEIIFKDGRPSLTFYSDFSKFG